MPRVPTDSDFPSSMILSITPPPPSSSHSTNVLILLHGLGDTHDSFTKLARQLNLAETTCISLCAPCPLPFDIGGFHWGDDIQIDQSSGNMEYDTGFGRVIHMLLVDVIENVLLKKCGFEHRSILLFGMGQGGMASLAVAAALGKDRGKDLAGVISLGGVVPNESKEQGVGTPVLVIGGERQTMVTKTGLERTKRVFKNVEYHKWGRAGDGMPRNREEMMPVMRFFARRLRSRAGVPEGAVEIG